MNILVSAPPKEKAGKSGSKKVEPKPEAAKKEAEGDQEGKWHLAYSPEGYPYYWNDLTSGNIVVFFSRSFAQR